MWPHDIVSVSLQKMQVFFAFSHIRADKQERLTMQFTRGEFTYE